MPNFFGIRIIVLEMKRSVGQMRPPAYAFALCIYCQLYTRHTVRCFNTAAELESSAKYR
jgi:hypothetical protein